MPITSHECGQIARQPARAHVRAKAGQRHAGAEQHLIAAQNLLVQLHPCWGDAMGGGGDDQFVIEAGGRQVIGLNPADGENRAFVFFQAGLINAQRARPFGPRAFDKA